MKLHDLPRPYRMAVPPEVVATTVDALRAQGHRAKKIGAALGIHYRTVYNILHRRGAYRSIERTS